MPDTQPSSDSGLASLSGFAYQIKVFVYLLTKASDGQQVEFETLDDLATNDIIKNSKQEDFCIKHRRDNAGITVFQVKQTRVGTETGRKILYNWMLAYNKNAGISKFVLYIDDKYSEKMSTIFDNWQFEYAAINESNKPESALITRVKHLYESDAKQFEQDFNYIKSNYSVEKIGDIDGLIGVELSKTLHASASSIGEQYYNQRIAEVFTRISSQILDCAEKRIPYICTQPEFMQICDDVCKNISPGKYEPNFSAFFNINRKTNVTDEIEQTREYKQLNYCNLSIEKILKHLTWETYYQNIRRHYLADAQSNIIEDIEVTAYDNFSDVVDELKSDDNDTPFKRLIKTKAKEISKLSEEHSRWGAYVFLTNDKAQHQISWKDKEQDNG